MKRKIAKLTAAMAAASLVVGISAALADDAEKSKDQAGQQQGAAIQEKEQAAQAGAQIEEAAGALAQKAEDPQGFINEAYQENLAEIELGRIGQQKGQSKEVKDFAQHLIDGHQGLNDKLKTLAEKKSVQPSEKLDAKRQKMVDECAGLSSADFDKKFLSAQIKAHKKAILLYQQCAAKNSDAEVKDFAQSNLPALQQHLQMAQQQSAVSEPAGAEQKEQQQQSEPKQP